VTLGDPAGIGPEVTLKALAAGGARGAEVLLLGRASFFSSLARRLGLRLKFLDVSDPGKKSVRGVYLCHSLDELPSGFRPGRADDRLTRAAVRSIETAVALCLCGEGDAIVTPPINKAALLRAGFRIPGHTEFLASLSGTKRFEMMLVGGGLRVVLVTRHLALKDVPRSVTARAVEETILLADRELRRSFGVARPRLVVCGLNPHAGEEGRFGREEIERIAPAVRRARKKAAGTVDGPLSPDALFHDAWRGRWDAVVCMYHDQGLIPLKMVSRGSGVNVTLGLPFVRTSPDHGTAYDIAGRNAADGGSMAEAMRLAVTLSLNRRKHERAHRRG